MFFSSGALLINQLVEKEMREKTELQNAKLDEIRKRTSFIRDRFEKQQKKDEEMFFNYVPQTYMQGCLI